MLVPLDVEDVVHVLQVHGDPLDAVRDLDADRGEIDAAHLLEIGELRDLHAVKPDFPAKTPGAERGRFPVVLHKTDVMKGGIDAEAPQTLQVHILDVDGRGLHDDLELVVMLESVWIFAVPPVCRAP